MAGALAVYVTNPNLAGTNIAGSQGFNISTTGTGAKTTNLNSDGTAAGLANNAAYPVSNLLQQANLEIQLGAFNATAFNNIFSNINQTGDIISGSSSAPLSVSCPAVTTGTVGVAFNSGAMSASGGTAPYIYSIVGTLPAGLTLNTATGAVTGTPTAAGIFSIVVSDSKAAGSTTRCSISIGSGDALSVNPSNVTVVAGQSAKAAFTFTPFGGYVGSVSFSCSGLPAGAACTFQPTTLTANGSNSVSNLDIDHHHNGERHNHHRTKQNYGRHHAGFRLLPPWDAAGRLHRLAAPVNHSPNFRHAPVGDGSHHGGRGRNRMRRCHQSNPRGCACRVRRGKHQCFQFGVGRFRFHSNSLFHLDRHPITRIPGRSHLPGILHPLRGEQLFGVSRAAPH